MTFSVRVGRRAAWDVRRIYAWLADRSREGADRWLNAFQRAAIRIAENPSELGLPLEEETVDEELRQFLFKTRRGRIYRAIYCIREHEVLILRVRGPGQPPLEKDELQSS